MALSLSDKWNIGQLRIPNRIVMAPMSTNRVDRSGYVTSDLIRYLVRRARGGCRMIIAESATVDFNTGRGGRNLRIDNEESLLGLRDLVEALHSHNTIVAAQLWHAGPRAQIETGLPLSPSGKIPGFPVCRALGLSEIETIVQQFVQAGDRAARAGFDAIEIHAAHGYLLHHFIDRDTNQRQDTYGGSVEGRYRILAEIRAGLRFKHPDIPVVLRPSLRFDEDFTAVANVIQEAGFDAVDIRTGFSSMSRELGTRLPAGYTLPLVEKLRSHLRLPLLTGGRILYPEQAEQAILKDGLDAVVLGRPLLADPDWCCKALTGQDVIPCRYDCVPSCYSRFKEGEQLNCVFYGRKE